jgi:hypothetical protein
VKVLDPKDCGPRFPRYLSIPRQSSSSENHSDFPGANDRQLRKLQLAAAKRKTPGETVRDPAGETVRTRRSLENAMQTPCAPHDEQTRFVHALLRFKYKKGKTYLNVKTLGSRGRYEALNRHKQVNWMPMMYFFSPLLICIFLNSAAGCKLSYQYPNDGASTTISVHPE